MGQTLTIINDTNVDIHVNWKPIVLGSILNEDYTIKAGDIVEHKAEPILYEVTITALLGRQPSIHQFNGASKANWSFDLKNGIKVLLLKGSEEPVPNETQLLGVPISNPEVQKILKGVKNLVDQGLVGA